MIVDTSALVAVLRREEGADRLVEQLLGQEDIHISAGTLIEARIVAERDGGTAEFDELLEAIGVEVVPVDGRQAEIAFEGFRRFGKGRHRAGLNFGDLFAYALARALDEPLLYTGADFVHTDVAAAVTP